MDIKVLQNIIRTRTLAHKYLIQSENTIQFLIVLYVLLFFYQDKKLSLKNLYSELPWSNISVSKNLNLLTKASLIVKKKSVEDKRISLLIPSQKLIKSNLKFLKALKSN